jgi:RNA polymerase sigma factor (sigma-70 family)
MIDFENDIVVLTALEKGDTDAFNYIYDLYFKPLCYFAEKLTNDNELAQDMASDSFLKLLQKKPHFDTLLRLKSFLYTTTRNSCFDQLRANKRHAGSHREMQYLFGDDEKSIEHAIIRTEVLNAAYTEIEKLPEKYKQVAKLALLEGKDNDEIVQETGMAYQTVRNHKSEAIKLLRLNIFRKGHLGDAATIYCIIWLSEHIAK